MNTATPMLCGKFVARDNIGMCKGVQSLSQNRDGLWFLHIFLRPD